MVLLQRIVVRRRSPLNSQDGGKWTELVGSIGAQELREILGPWPVGDGPLYLQLSGALERAIGSGQVPAASRLPSERQLSEAVGVSRTTVVAAYDRLREAGLIRSHRGSGTRVARPEQPWGATGRPRASFAAALLDTGPFAFGPLGNDIELTIGALPGAKLIAEETERVAREDLPALLDSFGYLPFGLPPLREAIAAHMTTLGVPTVAEQVLVTSGAQQAIDLLARQLGGPSTTVILENPTYPPAVDLFRAGGARLLGVEVDDAGLRIDMLRSHAARHPGSIVYVNPTCENPTGTVLPAGLRRELMRVADDAGLLVIDDLASAPLTLEGDPPPPLGSFDRADRVVSVGSLSKVAWGGLRVGWVRGPAALITRLAALKVDMDFSSSFVSQAVAVRLFDRYDELVSLARSAAAERLEAFESALASEIPGWTWTHPAGGLCLWVRVPTDDAAAFARVAADHGVVARAGQQFSPDGSHRDRLRLAYGHDPAALREAARRLSAAWAAYHPASRRHAAALAVTV